MPFNLQASIGLDGARFMAGMAQVNRGVDGLRGKFNSLASPGLKGGLAAAFGTGAIMAAAKNTVDYAGKINDFSERTDVSREALQKWDFALNQNGSSIESGVKFFEKLGASRQKALEGNEEAINNFKQLGISIDDLKNKRLEDIGLQIGNAVKQGDIQKIGVALREVGGKAAGELVPAFKAGLAEAFEEAEKLGIIIDEKTVMGLDAAGDAAAKLANQFRADIAPAVLGVVKLLQTFWDGLTMIPKVIGAQLGALAGGGGFQGMKEAGGAVLNDMLAAKQAREAVAVTAPGAKTPIDLEEIGAVTAPKGKKGKAARLAGVEREGRGGRGGLGANGGTFDQQLLEHLKAISRNTDPSKQKSKTLHFD